MIIDEYDELITFQCLFWKEVELKKFSYAFVDFTKELFVDFKTWSVKGYTSFKRIICVIIPFYVYQLHIIWKILFPTFLEIAVVS